MLYINGKRYVVDLGDVDYLTAKKTADSYRNMPTEKFLSFNFKHERALVHINNKHYESRMITGDGIDGYISSIKWYGNEIYEYVSKRDTFIFGNMSIEQVKKWLPFLRKSPYLSDEQLNEPYSINEAFVKQNFKSGIYFQGEFLKDSKEFFYVKRINFTVYIIGTDVPQSRVQEFCNYTNKLTDFSFKVAAEQNMLDTKFYFALSHKSPMLSSLVDSYMRYCLSSGSISESQLNLQYKQLSSFVLTRLGGMDINSITHDDIYADGVKIPEKSEFFLKKMFDYAIAKGTLTGKNPMYSDDIPWPPVGNLLFLDVLQEYIESLSETMTQKSIVWTVQNATNECERVFGNKALKDLTVKDILPFYNERKRAVITTSPKFPEGVLVTTLFKPFLTLP